MDEAYHCSNDNTIENNMGWRGRLELIRSVIIYACFMGSVIIFGWHCDSGGIKRNDSGLVSSVSDSTQRHVLSVNEVKTNLKSSKTSIGTGMDLVPGLQTDSFPDCHGRNCELEGFGACPKPYEVCDIFRNKCVPKCEGEKCCDNVRCPPGTVCVPGIGRCGKPAGEGWYDIGSAWWTGRDIKAGDDLILLQARPVDFKIMNDKKHPIYFTATVTQPGRFDLFVQYCGASRKLEIAENHFCPTLCPAEGPVMEVDCGSPQQLVTQLLHEQHLILTWSGQEQVGNRRIGNGPLGQFCYFNYVTLAGNYTFQVCYAEDMESGKAHQSIPNRFVGAKIKGEQKCQKLNFLYPSSSVVEVHITD